MTGRQRASRREAATAETSAYRCQHGRTPATSFRRRPPSSRRPPWVVAAAAPHSPFTLRGRGFQRPSAQLWVTPSRLRTGASPPQEPPSSLSSVDVTSQVVEVPAPLCPRGEPSGRDTRSPRAHAAEGAMPRCLTPCASRSGRNRPSAFSPVSYADIDPAAGSTHHAARWKCQKSVLSATSFCQGSASAQPTQLARPGASLTRPSEDLIGGIIPTTTVILMFRSLGIPTAVSDAQLQPEPDRFGVVLDRTRQHGHEDGFVEVGAAICSDDLRASSRVELIVGRPRPSSWRVLERRDLTVTVMRPIRSLSRSVNQRLPSGRTGIDPLIGAGRRLGFAKRS